MKIKDLIGTIVENEIVQIHGEALDFFGKVTLVKFHPYTLKGK